jgi:DHA1 family tetracycline resistance protein-like MFS transporter
MTTSPSSAPIDRQSLIFILVTAFLNLAGVGLVGPVTKFLVEGYVSDPSGVAVVNGLLFTSYSFFQFLAVPTLGILSDRFGRRPILLICVLGTAVGYFLFGLGGALWVLFAGRILDGITGGNIGTIYAYIADLTEPDERTRYYGLLGAISGLGFVVGPAVGGILSSLGGATAPVFFAALMSLLNAVWGYFAMPESLKPEQRLKQVNITKLNPFWQLFDIFQLPQLRALLIATFLWMLPFAMMQSNLAVLGGDWLGSREQDVALVFVIFGVVGVVVQGGLIRPLIKRFGEKNLAITGGILFALGFVCYALIPQTRSNELLILGTLILAVGNGLITPTLSSLISQTVGPQEQGRAQGGSQSVQALARVIGPTAGGVAYAQVSAPTPYGIGALLLLGAVAAIWMTATVLRPHPQ